ncbi:MAG: YitT family protein [Ruminococcaceae bacterium]|nr:YitT family protein [Oscillospiraceae bacterium]
MKKTSHPHRMVRTLTDWAYYVFGCLLYAVGVDMFITPNHLVPGGVTGVSILINYVMPAFPVGAGIFVINIPLLILAWIYIGRAFAWRTTAVTALASVIIDLLVPFVTPYTADPLLAALFGGVLSGLGLALVFLRGATTGGSEIVARLLEKKYPHISIGRFMLLVDGIIIAVSVPVFGQLESAMYAAVLVFVSSLVVDELIGGARRTRTVLIVTAAESAIAKELTLRSERGVTVMEATGAYTGSDRQVLMCAVRPSEVYPLRQLLSELDPDAFIIVLNSEQVLGAGFQS